MVMGIFAAGTAAAIALLLKPEFGIACYGCSGPPDRGPRFPAAIVEIYWQEI